MKRSHTAWLVCSAATTLAPIAAADIIVGNGPPPPLPSGTGYINRGDYQGDASHAVGNPPTWPNNFNQNTNPQPGVMQGSSYNANTHIATLNNLANENATKYLTVMIVSNLGPGFNYGNNAQGTPVTPALWASASAQGSTSTLTSAAWGYQNNLLTFWQTWTIVPQPGSETVDINPIRNELRTRYPNANAEITGIQAASICSVVPSPGSAALLGSGLLLAARRRR